MNAELKMNRNNELRFRSWPRSVSNDYRTYMYLAPDPSLTDYDDVYEYALTIDGYKYASEIWGIDGSSNAGWEKVLAFKHGNQWQGSFEDLRCCLFFYQRKIRWIESGAFAEDERKDFMSIYDVLSEQWPGRRELLRIKPNDKW